MIFLWSRSFKVSVCYTSDRPYSTRFILETVTGLLKSVEGVNLSNIPPSISTRLISFTRHFDPWLFIRRTSSPTLQTPNPQYTGSPDSIPPPGSSSSVAQTKGNNVPEGQVAKKQNGPATPGARGPTTAGELGATASVPQSNAQNPRTNPQRVRFLSFFLSFLM